MNWQVYAMVLWMCLFIGILLGIEDRRLRPAPDPDPGDRIHREMVRAAMITLSCALVEEARSITLREPARQPGQPPALWPGQAVYHGTVIRGSMPASEVLITPDGRRWVTDGRGGWTSPMALEMTRRGLW